MDTSRYSPFMTHQRDPLNLLVMHASLRVTTGTVKIAKLLHSEEEKQARSSRVPGIYEGLITMAGAVGALLSIVGVAAKELKLSYRDLGM